MTPSSAAQSQAAEPAWCFGSYPYGLEALTLPLPGDPLRTGDPWAVDLDAGRAQLRQLHDDPPPAAVEPAATAEELFWFRWIIGHQLCFIWWRLMADQLHDVESGRRHQQTVIEPVRRYVEAYSAMLLYTGSCPRPLYHAVIRPSMALQHRGFSGGWAPDFLPVRDIFRNYHPLLASPGAEQLHDAVRRCASVHATVAGRLVPNGASLLHDAALHSLDDDLAHTLYDAFFVTVRAPISHHRLLEQLLDRVTVVQQDLAANGLHPTSTDPDAVEDDRVSSVRAAGSAAISHWEDRLVPTIADAALRAWTPVATTGRGTAPADHPATEPTQPLSGRR